MFSEIEDYSGHEEWESYFDNKIKLRNAETNLCA
jgi:hypothetical protein